VLDRISAFVEVLAQLCVFSLTHEDNKTEPMYICILMLKIVAASPLIYSKDFHFY